MRVTENTNFQIARGSISNSRERMENLQRQSATLKKVNAPSEDPVGSAKVLEIRTAKLNNDQFITNARMAEMLLNNSDQAIGELSDIIVRAKEIAIGQSSGASATDDTRLGLAEEVNQLYLQAVATANRRIGDRYLFGGFKTNEAPIDTDGRYRGDDGKIMAEVGKDVFIAVNVPGIEVFNTNPRAAAPYEPGMQHGSVSGSGRGPASAGRSGQGLSGSADGQNINLFDQLQELRIGLLTGDLDTIRNTLENFDAVHGSLLAARSKVGSRVQGLETNIQSLERQTLTNAALSSQIEDADMAQVVSDLAREETVFRSALQSAQKLIQPSLMDFLK